MEFIKVCVSYHFKRFLLHSTHAKQTQKLCCSVLVSFMGAASLLCTLCQSFSEGRAQQLLCARTQHHILESACQQELITSTNSLKCNNIGRCKMWARLCGSVGGVRYSSPRFYKEEPHTTLLLFLWLVSEVNQQALHILPAFGWCYFCNQLLLQYIYKYMLIRIHMLFFSGFMFMINHKFTHFRIGNRYISKYYCPGHKSKVSR